MKPTDQQLIQQYQQSGRVDCLDELLRRHLQRIRGMVFQMLLDHDLADDVTQDIFLRVVHGIDRFEGRSEFRTWLYRVAMNSVRTAQTRTAHDRSADQKHLDEIQVATHFTPDEPLLQAELAAEVQLALKGLSPSLRAAIVLVCLQGQTPAGAAEIEGCSTDTMYWRVHEARRQLKLLLAEHLG